MAGVAAIGDRTRIAGLALAGVAVFPAATAREVRSRWDNLSSDVHLVIITPEAADALAATIGDRTSELPLMVVMPP